MLLMKNFIQPILPKKASEKLKKLWELTIYMKKTSPLSIIWKQGQKTGLFFVVIRSMFLKTIPLSLLMNLPEDFCPAGGFLKEFIRQLKLKKEYLSSRNLKHWPLFLCRIIFGCIRSWRE